MSQIVNFEFALDTVTIEDGKLVVPLSAGVKLTADAPDWIKEIKSAMLCVVLEVEGSPPNANSKQPPVV